MTPKRKLVLKISLILLIVILAYYLNSRGLFKKGLIWIENFKPWSPLIFITGHILACVFLVPSFFFTFSAGVLFGLRPGFVYSLTGLVMGSLAAFLIGRFIARGWVLSLFSKSKRFRMLDEMVRRKGWKIVLLGRLSPIFPFTVGNYAFGLTKLSARKYFVATFIGTIPSTFVYVYLGVLTGSLAGLANGNHAYGPPEWLLFLIGILATVAVSLYLRRITKLALAESIRSEIPPIPEEAKEWSAYATVD